MSRIIILGVDHHNTLSLVRLMGEKGYDVVVILYNCERDSSFVAASRYCKDVYVVSKAAEAVSILKSVLTAEEKTIVLTGADQISSLMDLEYDYFVEKCYFFNAGKAGKITHYMDKNTQALLAQKVGLIIPITMECYSKSLTEASVPYPCIIKPKESIHGGKDICICYNRDELLEAVKSFSTGNPILLQQYIQKEKEIVVLGYSVKGETYISGFVEKHRDYKGATTYSTTYSPNDLPVGVGQSCKDMLKEINYSGLWGIEFIQSNNCYYFIELNLRNDATSYSLAFSGDDFVNSYCEQIQKGVIQETAVGSFNSVNSMVEFEDFNFVLKREVPLLKWIKEKRNCKCLFLYNPEDKRPYRIRRRNYILFLFKRLFHR